MLDRTRVGLRIALAQLRNASLRTVLAVLGVTVAVSLVVLLVGLGYGVLTTGADAMTYIQADLWMAGGPVTVAPGAIGGVENPIQGSHATASRLEARDGVEAAQPLAFQTVYVSPNASQFGTVVGVGGLGDGQQLGIADTPNFTPTDVHYANGSYDGPMTGEIVIGPQLAARYNLSVGESLYVGGTLVAARNTPFEIIAISNTYTRFLGTPTVTLHLSELQEVSGTTGTDGAALIAVRTADGTQTATAKRALEQAFPEFEVRTNSEQVQAIVGDQAAVVASSLTLVVVSVVVGLTLVVNVLTTMVYQQRREFAALKAAGLRGRTLVGVVLWQGLLVGLGGGLLAIAVARPAADGLNIVTEALATYPLVQMPLWLLGGGLGLAVIVGLAGAGIAGWQVVRLGPLEHLE
jgi:putative ABC transport system permease protein